MLKTISILKIPFTYWWDDIEKVKQKGWLEMKTIAFRKIEKKKWKQNKNK